MTTCTNFDSCNGWVMPGSGRRVSFGPEDCFVDENGDLWVPCCCQTQMTGNAATTYNGINK